MLLTSENDGIDEVFSGYAYIESDLIFGNEGYQQYRNSTGRIIRRGHDGCYVIGTRRGAGYEFETDYAGYKKIFYYWSLTLWAVSDSFITLVHYLRSVGVRIRPRYATLTGVSARGSTMEQSFSHYTAAESVLLLPLHCRLHISAQGARAEKASNIEGSSREKSREADYAARLKRHLSIWLNRFEHWLVEPNLDLTLELTGGLDSRVNLTMYLAARRRLGSAQEVRVPRFQCGSGTGARDLEVAHLLADTFNLPLNSSAPKRAARLSGRQRYDRWREVSLGSYHPIYFPVLESDPREIRVGGSAAGNHRPFYQRNSRSPSEERLVRTCADRVWHEYLKGDVERDMREFFSHLPAWMTGSQKLIEHYRHFRNRLHSGRATQYRVLFTPFSSRSLDKTFMRMAPERVDAGQINYDIMASLAPELLDIEFDEKQKSPSDRVREMLRVVEVDEGGPKGRIWGQATPAQRSETAQNESALGCLGDAYEEALSDPFVSSFWPDEVKAAADQALEYAGEHGKFKHASTAAPVSAVLLSYEVSPYK